MDFLLPVLIGIAIGFGLGWMALSGKLSALRERIGELTQDVAKAQGERTEFHERALTAEANNKAIEQRLKDREEQLKLEFEKTATGIFDQISKKFTTQSEKQIGDLLNPFRERLVDFQKLVNDSFTAQGKEQHTLKSEIEKIVLQTDSLTKALRGDVKAQGNWGEVILERILEASGLQKDVTYTVQGSGMGLTDGEGARRMPDVIINLPDNKHIIIDAKVTLTHYERYCSETDEAVKDTHLKQFLRSVRTHVGGLEGKRYQDNEKLASPDFVFMFMPVEGAYSLAVQQDPELHAYAWSRRIVIVCPSTLFATLQTIASLWRIEKQNKHADEIAKRGGLLYEKFLGFLDDMKVIGDRLTQVQKSYDNALGKLSDGRGNLISQAEKLKEYGAKTTSSLPKEFARSIEDGSVVIEAEVPERIKLTS